MSLEVIFIYVDYKDLSSLLKIRTGTFSETIAELFGGFSNVWLLFNVYFAHA